MGDTCGVVSLYLDSPIYLHDFSASTFLNLCKGTGNNKDNRRSFDSAARKCASSFAQDDRLWWRVMSDETTEATADSFASPRNDKQKDRQRLEFVG
jgi:hypothetical protein